jgi:predicted RNase H-like HicB family nuclease
MKSFDVIVGKQNGHFLASVLSYPHIAQIGATAEEAVGKAKSAMEEFLTSAQVVTVTVGAPEANGSSVQQLQATKEATAIAASEYPLAEAWARNNGIRWQDPNDPVYQSYLASLALLKQQEREAARLDAESEVIQ